MDKGDLRIKRKKGSSDYVTFDPRISVDKRTFVLRAESSKKMNWFEYLNAIASYALEEMDKITSDESGTSH